MAASGNMKPRRPPGTADPRHTTNASGNASRPRANGWPSSGAQQLCEEEKAA